MTPDREQRDLILRELDVNMVVEAAAGTGKTTMMVDRMVALLAEGKCEIANLVAITFTRKAAAELRDRFYIELERAAREETGEKKERLESATLLVDRCYIGTIHSFCARLLRERPVEAGVGLDFEEVDEEVDAGLRREAWDEYVAGLVAGSDPLLEDLLGMGLEVNDLRDVFINKFANYPDVLDWPSDPGPEPDAKETVRAELEEYAERMRGLRPQFPATTDRDGLMKKYVTITLKAHPGALESDAGLMEVLEEFVALKDVSPVLKRWPGGAASGIAKEEKEKWDDFKERYAEPLVAWWREYRYGYILRAMKGAKDTYDRLREEQGFLNFQDLLMKSAALLRDSPHVRGYFSKLFTHILVDEFQDTDPIQAEVVILLAADDPTEKDWRMCNLRPGSLFVVGDPKQSIYRFRRADIVTYNRVKKIIAKTSENEVPLTANFRSTSDIIDWVNEFFGPVFPETASVESPGYYSLELGNNNWGNGDLRGVYRISIPKELSRNRETSVDYDSDVIARFIKYAIDEGVKIPRTQKELDAGKSSSVQADDFLILTRVKCNLKIYARKLQELGIPHTVTGGGALKDVPELSLLHLVLRASMYPEDPVALVAALRSELLGIDDVSLYNYKKEGGEFSFEADIPGDLDKETFEVFEDAFARLKKYRNWLTELSPVPAVEKVAGDLGLFARSGLSPGGDVLAGSLSKGIELLRSAREGLWTVADIVDYLGQLVGGEAAHDGLSLHPGVTPSVRVMNLHKAKGLEAPIVFLADPTGGGPHEPDLHIDRSEDENRGYMVISKQKGRGKSLIALPPGWDEICERERKFEEAEKLRLLYVAATRAGSVLVVTDRNNKQSPWLRFRESLSGCPELEIPSEVEYEPEEPEPFSPEEYVSAGNDILGRWESIKRATYEAEAAKKLAVKDTRIGRAATGHGVEWGEFIHRLLKIKMLGGDKDLNEDARVLLVESELDIGIADEAVILVQVVTDSDLWKRAQRSDKRLVEVPFETLLDKPGRSSNIPLLVRGIIDLAFLEEDAWVIIDYKTDEVPAAEVGDLVEHYRPQVEIYAKAWEKCVREPVKEIGLYFTHLDTYVEVPLA